MKPLNTRRFTIADVMILIVAAAVGSLCVKAFLPGFARQMRFVDSQSTGGLRLVMQARSWLFGPGSCVVVPLMLATVVFRLRQPRPRWRRIVRQPGFAACLAVAVSLVPGALLYATMRHRPGFSQRTGIFDQVWLSLIRWTDSAVIGAWLTLALSRRWRPSSDWVDRLGRLFGAYWIFLFVFGLVLTFVTKLYLWML